MGDGANREADHNSQLTTHTSFPFLPEVISGDTADVYFLRTCRVLEAMQRDPEVGFEIFPVKPGILCGVTQVGQLLTEAGFDGELWALAEGARVERGEPVIELFGRYSSFGKYETAILGILASCSGWATAAREVVDVAGQVPVISFGARHIHPNVAGIMDYAAVVGGCVAASTPLGSRLAGTSPSGTMSHAFILIAGDTVGAARCFDQVMEEDVPRIVLVDTFEDPAVESVRVAQALGSHLRGVRLDTPSERGGVTPGLVKEVRARLDLAGFESAQIVVTGGVNPERIRRFSEAGAPVDAYGVGSYITSASPLDFTGDVREVEGKPVAKLGRIPGMLRSPRLSRVR